MAQLGNLDIKIRSKNAGPFWITADIFCQTRPIFEIVRTRITEQVLADCLNVPADSIMRFDIEKLFVLKFSLPSLSFSPSLRLLSKLLKMQCF